MINKKSASDGLKKDNYCITKLRNFDRLEHLKIGINLPLFFSCRVIELVLCTDNQSLKQK